MASFSIGGTLIKNNLVQAPLAGYTDYAMRTMAYEYGAGLVYTEMESCESLYYCAKPTLHDLAETKMDKKRNPEEKIALQIFGGKSDVVLSSIPLFEKYGDYDFLDFNCGCPVPKVIRQHAGSYWLTRTEELIELAKNMVKISSKPVIFKMRIGFDTPLDMPTLCKKLEDVGIQGFAIHGRIRSEFFSGPVHYDVIKAIKEKVSVPVIANGEITASNFQQVLADTGADAVMIGQHAMGYPKIFEDMSRIEQGFAPKETTLKQQIEDLKKHLSLIFSAKEEHSAAGIMRSISVKYLKGFDDVKKIRNELVHCETEAQYLEVLSRAEKTIEA